MASAEGVRRSGRGVSEAGFRGCFGLGGGGRGGGGMASAEGLRRSVKGLSEAEFRERFGTEEACRKVLFDMRWREGLSCPACGGRRFCALRTRKVFQCNRCKKQVRLTAGTV